MEPRKNLPFRTTCICVFCVAVVAQSHGASRTGKPAPRSGKGAIPVEFTLKQAGRVSVNVYRDDGRLVHQLLIGKPMKAGTHRVSWDGCDDTGKPVAKGTYSFKGLCGNVRSVWDGKMCNTSPAAAGEWTQYRTGHYYDVAALPKGALVTLSSFGEHGRVLQAIDGGPGYPVRYSAPRQPYPACGIALAVDGPNIYGVFTRWKPNTRRKPETSGREVVARWDAATGKIVPYKDAKNSRISEWGEIWLNAPRTHTFGLLMSPPEDRNNPYDYAHVCGLAARNGTLYVPFLKENRVALLDAASGRELKSFRCPTPRKIALDKQGRIYVTSGHEVLRFAPDGMGETAIVTGLSDACAIAIGPKGTIYVTDLGTSHQIKVYNADGSPVRTFGRLGGHRGGRVAPDLLECPIGISVNEQGTIFVADLGGMRVLAFNPDFTVRKEIHGRMPYTLSLSNLDPRLAYFGWPGMDFVEYTVDYKAKTSRMTRRWNSRTQPRLLDWPFSAAGGPTFFHRWNGRTFAIWPAYPAVAELVDDQLLPRLRLGYTSKHPFYQFPRGVVNDRAGWSPDKVAGSWMWRDRNADGVMQASEFEFGQWPMAKTYYGWHGSGWVDADGNMYNCLRKHGRLNMPIGVIQYPFEGLDEHGLPKYSYASAKYVIEIPEDVKNVGIDGKRWGVCPEGIITDKAGNFYVGDNGDMFSRPGIPMGILKYTADGKFVWRVGRRLSGLRWDPGEMSYCGRASGLVDDRYLFFVDYRGEMNIWDTDGLWVGRLFDDVPEGFFLAGETFHGSAFRHKDGTVYAYSSPDCVYRAPRIVVKGIDAIERFTGTTRVTAVAKPRVIVKEEKAWFVLRRRDPVWVDGDVNVREWGIDTDTQAPERFYYGSQEVGRSWAQWDDDALYLAWRIKDATPAINGNVGAGRWNGDQVEFMIRASTTAPAGPHRAEDYQIAIGTDRNSRLGAYVQMNGGGKQDTFLENAKVGLRIDDDKRGYTMEARIPWASLGKYRPKAGDMVRWSMNICFGDATGEGLGRHVKWKTGRHGSPGNWGKALFK